MSDFAAKIISERAQSFNQSVDDGLLNSYELSSFHTNSDGLLIINEKFGLLEPIDWVEININFGDK